LALDRLEQLCILVRLAQVIVHAEFDGARTMFVADP
jgi:hypothetical protein